MEELIVVLVCLLLNAIFAAYEMAFVSVSKPELRSLSRAGNKHAQTILLLREHPERTLSVIQIGITMVGAIAAAVGGVGATESLEPYFKAEFNMRPLAAQVLAIVVVVVPISYLNVVIGELVPKTLALRNPTKVVLAGAKWLFLADRYLAPVVSVLEWSTRKFIKLFFRKPKVPDQLVQTIIEIDSFSPVHQRFMLNMAQIEKKRIRDTMVPWSQVNHVRLDNTINEVFQVVLSSGHTRLPVADNNLVVGILHTKEFVALKESGEMNWQPLIRSPLRVQASDSALGVMRLMQEKHSHMAIVFSPTERLGIVTLEDIIEEVVGDIFDEDDDGKVRKVFAAKGKARASRRE